MTGVRVAQCPVGVVVLSHRQGREAVLTGAPPERLIHRLHEIGQISPGHPVPAPQVRLQAGHEDRRGERWIALLAPRNGSALRATSGIIMGSQRIAGWWRTQGARPGPPQAVVMTDLQRSR